MKAFLTILVALSLGIGAAYLFFKLESAALTESYPIDGWPNTGKTVDAECDFVISSPQSVTLPGIFSGQLVRYQVFVENVGPVDGEIWVSELPQGIRLLSLETGVRKRIAPHTRYLLDLGIVGDLDNSNFDQLLTINTSQSNRPKLGVRLKANIFPGVGVLPEGNLTFTSQDFAQRTAKEIFPVSWLSEPLRVKSVRLDRSPELFQIDILEISEESRSQLRSARSARTIRVTPQGEFPKDRGKIMMFIELENADIPELEVAIRFGE